jgi:hypothetical protein
MNCRLIGPSYNILGRNGLWPAGGMAGRENPNAIEPWALQSGYGRRAIGLPRRRINPGRQMALV